MHPSVCGHLGHVNLLFLVNRAAVHIFICVFSHHSLASKRYHGQQNLQGKTFNMGLVYSFRALVHYHHSGGCGSRQVGLVLEK